MSFLLDALRLHSVSGCKGRRCPADDDALSVLAFDLAVGRKFARGCHDLLLTDRAIHVFETEDAQDRRDKNNEYNPHGSLLRRQ